jgi:hypothetical protein
MIANAALNVKSLSVEDLDAMDADALLSSLRQVAIYYQEGQAVPANAWYIRGDLYIRVDITHRLTVWYTFIDLGTLEHFSETRLDRAARILRLALD